AAPARDTPATLPCPTRSSPPTVRCCGGTRPPPHPLHVPGKARFRPARERGVVQAGAAITRGLDAFFAAYLEELRRAIGDGSRVQVMPGVAAVVSALAARDDALVGLLTGNIEAGARLKLAPTGLWPLFSVGAFGSDDM